ncbi:MAG: hypothetical protein KF756_02625 [Acidobacteria bacterium]|nr:hypothetical protein [Acidobacteriota bacterium]
MKAVSLAAFGRLSIRAFVAIPALCGLLLVACRFVRFVSFCAFCVDLCGLCCYVEFDARRVGVWSDVWVANLFPGRLSLT